MLYIIIGIVVVLIIIGIIIAVINAIGTLFENIIDAIGSARFIIIVVTVILCIIAYFVFSFSGVLAVAIAGVVVILLMQLILVMGKALREHDRNRKEVAEINQETQKRNALQQNEYALRQELDRNCRFLGEMNTVKWAAKLPNYKDKPYQSSFEKITTNFAEQMEQQNITQSDKWFHPYLEYIVNHRAGTTPTKLLNEVDCPQLQVTHTTPNIELLKIQLEKGTNRVSRDVPPLFDARLLEGMTEKLYVPTEYALITYGKDGETEDVHQEEIDFNNL